MKITGTIQEVMGILQNMNINTEIEVVMQTVEPITVRTDENKDSDKAMCAKKDINTIRQYNLHKLKQSYHKYNDLIIDILVKHKHSFGFMEDKYDETKEFVDDYLETITTCVMGMIVESFENKDNPDLDWEDILRDCSEAHLFLQEKIMCYINYDGHKEYNVKDIMMLGILFADIYNEMKEIYEIHLEFEDRAD